ncbi:hypothetical protein [Streptomyces roseus]|uniref:hypothetical protein n=1 Tax=Streptomyces roseus TaxID=66430 RepID=UPI003CC9171B
MRQGPDGVEADVRVAGVRRTMRSRYVEGCDGARAVRCGRRPGSASRGPARR